MSAACSLRVKIPALDSNPLVPLRVPPSRCTIPGVSERSLFVTNGPFHDCAEKAANVLLFDPAFTVHARRIQESNSCQE